MNNIQLENKETVRWTSFASGMFLKIKWGHEYQRGQGPVVAVPDGL